MNVEKEHKERVAFAKLNAFRVYLKYGLGKVQQLYKDHLDFVKENQGKSYSEVENMLIPSKG